MSWNIQKPGDYINGPLTVTGTLSVTGAGPHSIAGQVASSGATAGFQMQPRDGSGANWLWYNPTGDDARLYNNVGNDVLIVNNIGNLGLGIAPSAWQTTSYKVFQIGSTVAMYCDSNAYSVISNNTFINASYSERYLVNSFATKQTTFQGTHSFWTAPTGIAGDPISFTERVVFENLGDVNVKTGNVKVSSGKGIDFSAASNVAGMTSELLNDYEEGTWTPTITAETGTPTSVTVNTAVYTKTGRLVCVGFDFTVVDKGTASNSLRFTLPFIMSVGSQCGAFRETSNIGWMGMVTAATTSIGSLNLYNNGTPWVNSYRFQGSFTYFA
jgi:hypothetical protein